MNRIPLLYVMCALACVVGCQKAASPLVGTWRATAGQDLFLLTLRGDGSFALNVGREKSSDDILGTFSGDRAGFDLRPISENRGPALLHFEILALGESEMNVRITPQREIITFSRISKDPGPMSPSEAHARTPAGQAEARERERARMEPLIDKAVLNNARQLAAAADQYFLENGVTVVDRSELVGPTQYIKALNTVAGESYPTRYEAGRTITVTAIAGARTITYVP